MTPSDLEITVELIAEKGVAVLHLEGSLDSHTFQTLEKSVDEQFRRGCHKIVFEMSKLEYVSSAGCGQFVSAMSEALAHDGIVVLVNPSQSVQSVLNMVGLVELLTVARDLDEALEKSVSQSNKKVLNSLDQEAARILASMPAAERENAVRLGYVAIVVPKIEGKAWRSTPIDITPGILAEAARLRDSQSQQ